MNFITDLNNIREDSLVLEIGSGNSPWMRSDILVDQYLEDSYSHRGGADIFIDNRPLLITSGDNLPLRDKSIDFVYSSQVLDHVEDPVAVLREMARVGKAGYIECSNPLMERLQNPPCHLWYVTAYNNKLYLAAKTPETNISTELDQFVFHLLSDHFLIKHELGWKNWTPKVKMKYNLMEVYRWKDCHMEDTRRNSGRRR